MTAREREDDLERVVRDANCGAYAAAMAAVAWICHGDGVPDFGRIGMNATAARKSRAGH